jgi:hypothetical protein
LCQQGTILNKLAAVYPALVAVNIDDFVDSVAKFYKQSYVTKIHAALHAPGGRAVQLIPTHYYGGPGKSKFVLAEHPWLPSVTDGVLSCPGLLPTHPAVPLSCRAPLAIPARFLSHYFACDCMRGSCLPPPPLVDRELRP